VPLVPTVLGLEVFEAKLAEGPKAPGSPLVAVLGLEIVLLVALGVGRESLGSLLTAGFGLENDLCVAKLADGPTPGVSPNWSPSVRLLIALRICVLETLFKEELLSGMLSL
jgi:hypothetical protein